MVVNQNMPRGSKVAKRQKAESIHDRDRIIVRLPDGMRDKIAAMAAANGRSMTAEVIAALEEHLKSGDRITRLEDAVEKNREKIEEIWDSIQMLEREVERFSGAPFSGLRAARKAAQEDRGT
jgi:plasmid stability protein